MLNTQYKLKTILDAVSKTTKSSDPKQKVQKRTIFNNAALGGISSTALKALFWALPIIEYAILFNPKVFNYLGIAQSIIFYIVFLSIVMIIIFLISSQNNKKVFKKIQDSWHLYFPDIDLKMLLSSGMTPFRDFFNHYSLLLDKNLDDELLHEALREAFDQMKEENRDLIEAMERDTSR